MTTSPDLDDMPAAAQALDFARVQHIEGARQVSAPEYAAAAPSRRRLLWCPGEEHLHLLLVPAEAVTS